MTIRSYNHNEDKDHFLPEELTSYRNSYSYDFLRSLMDNDAYDDIERLIEDHKESKAGHMSIISENDMYWLSENLTSKQFTLPRHRLTIGFEAGHIDLISQAYTKTEKGWINSQLKVVAANNASLKDIENTLIPKNITLIDSFSNGDLERLKGAERLELSGMIIAEKGSDGKWIKKNRGSFNPDEVERVLAHSNFPFYVYDDAPDGDMYRGSVTDGLEASAGLSTLEGSSKYGDAYYASSSLSEAVRIYANPFSLESSGRILGLQDKGLADKNSQIVGHVHRMSAKGTQCQNINLNEIYPTALDTPSITSMMLIAELAGVSRILTARLSIGISKARSTFEAFSLISEFSDICNRNGGDNSTLKKIYQSLGFSAIKIELNMDLLKSVKCKIEQLNDHDEEYFKMLGAKKETLLKDANQQFRTLTQAIPKGAQGDHLIAFNKDVVKFEFIKTLPLNRDMFNTPRSGIYNRETTLEIDEITSLESPTQEEIEKFKIERAEYSHGIVFI